MHVIESADAHDEFGALAEHPVRDVNLMRAELGRQTARKLLVLAPVIYSVGDARRQRTVPGIFAERVAMPLRLHIGDLTQDALVDHLPRGLVILAVAALQADLQSLLRVFVGEL